MIERTRADATPWGRVDPQTRQFNALVERAMDREPSWETLGAVALRERLARGFMGPPPEQLASAETQTIPGPAGELPIRVLRGEDALGVYLHIHGGGFVLGGHDQQDRRLMDIAERAKVAVVSVGYRLAPEHRYPAAHDDCEAAAGWLIENARDRFDTDRLIIGGESAGAALTVGTLLRLRDEHRGAFRGAVLSYGGYDMRGTASCRHWGERRLVLNTPLWRWYKDQYVDPEPRDNGELSPLLARLHDLPPALISVGTEDLLLDDSLLLATRWRAAGNEAELRVYPGGAHSFDTMPIPIGREVRASIEHFIARCLG